MDLVVRLPQHIVFYHVAPHHDYTTWVRATAVSRTWRQLFLPAPPPGEDIPWICINDKNEKIYTISPTKTSTSPLPVNQLPLTGRLIGSCSHYMLTMSPSLDNMFEIMAFNTITSPNPPFPVVPGFTWPPMTGKGPAILTFAPGTSNCVAALAFISYNKIIVFGPREDEPAMTHTIPFHSNDDMIFHKDKLFLIDYDGELKAVNLHGEDHRPHHVICKRHHTHYPDPFYDLMTSHVFMTSHYLVESCGKLLLVLYDSSLEPTFIVQRVDEEQGKLVMVDNLGDQMLFVGRGCSRSVSYGYRAWPTKFFTHNCIYFIDVEDAFRSTYRLGKFCLKNRVSTFDGTFLETPFECTPHHHPLWISHPPD